MMSMIVVMLRDLTGHDVGEVRVGDDVGVLISGHPGLGPCRHFRFDGEHQQSAASWDKIVVFREVPVQFIELPR